jgi:multidrug resistance efflux pump
MSVQIPMIRLPSILSGLVATIFCLHVTLCTAENREPIEIQQCVVRYAKEIRVPALTTGRIVECTVSENEAVDSGQSLLRLDDASLIVARQAAKLKVESATRDARDRLPIEYAEVALQEAEEELDSSRDVQREAEGAVALNTIRRLRLAVERGKLEVAEANRHLERAELESRLREAELSQIDAKIKDLVIEAPIDGIILSVEHQVGEWVEMGQPVVTVGQASTLMVDALVHASQLPMDRCEGLPVSVHWTDSIDVQARSVQPRSLRGFVKSCDRRWLNDDQYRIHAIIENEPIASTSGRNETTANDRTHGDGKYILQPGRSVTLRIYDRDH